jgi:hypothetical protein
MQSPAEYARYFRTRLAFSDRAHPGRARRRRAAREAAERYFAPRGVPMPDSLSTGADLTDYALLHRYVLSRKPRRVLELGSGVTTAILADALAETGGHLVTYEAIPMYRDDMLAKLPERLKPVVTSILAERDLGYVAATSGVRYAGEIAGGPFDMIFVDGPDAHWGDVKYPCLDALYALQRWPDHPADVITDFRNDTAEFYQSLLPPGRMRFDYVLRVGFGRALRGSELARRPTPRRVRPGDAMSLLV